MQKMEHLLIQVYGKVQGVFYRQSTKAKADELQLKGSVKNLPDGSVEIKVYGSSDQLEELIEWCKSGPERAVVEEVKVSGLVQGEELYKDFQILR